MNIHFIPPLIISFCILFLGCFVFSRNAKRPINRIFFFLSLATFVWLFFYSFAYKATDSKTAFLWLKIGYTGITFIGISGFYCTIEILKMKRLRRIIFFGYLIASIFAILVWKSPYVIKDVYKFFWGFYPLAGSLHPIFLIFFVGSVSSACVLLAYSLWFNRSKLSHLENAQIKYVLLAFSIYSSASVDFLPNYKIEIYPFGYIFVVIYMIIFSYTIIKYRLLDIGLVITRTGIFVATYSLILGIPFFVAYHYREYLIGMFGDNWWLAPMVLLTVLATVGPFIYIYINSKAENRLLREQRQYQNTLRQASSGMIREKELKRLLNLIVHVVTRTVKLEFASIYLFDPDNKQYKMEARRDSSDLPKNHTINIDSPLILNFRVFRDPLVYEEIQLQAQDNPRDSSMMALEQQLKSMKAAVVIPSYVGNKMLGFIVLGKKRSGKIFSQDDLNVFLVLANQAALAIENAQFYEDIKETQEQLFQAEKMATVGTMADGLSHQINNRFQALSLISGDSLDILKTTEISGCSEDVKSAFGQLKYAFERIQSNVMQGGEIVRGLLKYSRPGQSGFEPVDINKVLDGALEMAQYKVRLNELNILRDIPADLPQIKCNLTQLEEVFFNMVDNAYDAIKERQFVNKDFEFKGEIRISARVEDDHMKIIFRDNGIGVKDKDKEKLFTPFFTTKATNKKGTGLGLYVIQKIVGFHNGTISIDSTYNKGTTFNILLPLKQA